MADLIGVGLTGLRAHQLALSVTGNNVANTNTQGYSRQEAVFKTSQSSFTGSGYVGQGVNVNDISRIAESFVSEQLRADTSIYSQRSASLEQATAIDNLLASTTTGLTPVMSSFFQAFQGAADDPSSVPQRQLLLTRAEGLVSRFKSINESLNSQKEFINQELEAAVSEINSLAEGLVRINQALASASTTSSGGQPNELLDERDEALRKLSELVSVTAVDTGADGQLNVFIGNGQPLVVGSSATRLSTIASPQDSTRSDIALSVNGNEQPISGNLNGGKIGALLDFRDGELQRATNSLGRIAMVLADTVNAQHNLGIDMENTLGGDFFRDINNTLVAQNRVTPNGNNTAPFDQSLRVDIVDTSALTTDDYEVRFDGPGNNDFTVVRLPDAEVVLQSTLPGIFPTSVEFEGFDLVFEQGTFKTGDYFTVTPTRNGAAEIQTQVDRVDELAFASPIRANTHLGNAGNASISQGEMLNVTSPITNQTLDIFQNEGELNPPLGIRFIRDNYYEVLDMSDPANPVPMVPPRNNLLYRPGQTNDLFTTDPGETMISATGADTQTIPAPAPSAGTLVNGYGAQALTFLNRDDSTGLITSQTYNVVANSSAETIAAGLTAIAGVDANAYTQVQLSNFVDDGDPTPLGIEINGETLSIPVGTSFGPDALADAINDNTNLAGQNIYAVSDGVNLEIRAYTGADIEVVVTGAGDSVDVSKIDPYSAGTPVLSTQTVGSGQGVRVGGTLDVTMENGVSMTADVESVFEQASPPQSTYFGFTYSIQGQPQAGDRFSIDYNTDGISDNRNALAIAQLEGQGLVEGGVTSYGEAYSKIVQEIGTVTNRARLDEEAAKALLDQSQQARDAISGVSLDEEAGRLVQYQAAYNASAQVVSVARQLFDTLLGAFS